MTVVNLFIDSQEVSPPIPFSPSGRDPVLSRQHEGSGRLSIEGSEGAGGRGLDDESRESMKLKAEKIEMAVM